MGGDLRDGCYFDRDGGQEREQEGEEGVGGDVALFSNEPLTVMQHLLPSSGCGLQGGQPGLISLCYCTFGGGGGGCGSSCVLDVT